MSNGESIEWKKRGDEFIKSEKYEDAIKCYKEALKINPNYVSAWNNLGFVNSKLGRIDEAKKCREKINELKKIASVQAVTSQLPLVPVAIPAERKKGIIKRIPGFRSGTWWKMVLAVIGYGFIALVIIGAIIGAILPTESPSPSPLMSSSQPTVVPSQSTIITPIQTTKISTPIPTQTPTTPIKTQTITSTPTLTQRTWAPTPTQTYYQSSSSSGSSGSTCPPGKYYVNGYYREGTYVSGYCRSYPSK